MPQRDTNIFDLVKERVDLAWYIEQDVGSRTEKAGSVLRVNPCPFCGHNDCFSIFGDRSFNCFSCQKSGTVIDYEMFRRGYDNPLEAARSAAEKAGIDVGEVKKLDAPSCRSFTPHQGGKRAGELRELITDFYHRELLSNEPALRYQMEERGHSLEILKAFQAGYAGAGSLVSFVEQHGFHAEDLVRIGLVRRRGDDYEPCFQPGDFIYPHRVKEEIVFFTRKNPNKTTPKYQVRKEYAAAGWFCFNQDALDSGAPIIVVEGENDCLSVAGKAGKREVIAIIGEFNTANILDHLKSKSRGRSFYLCFDRDPAGAKYAKRYGEAILAGGGKVHTIQVPSPHKDIDDFLRDSKDPPHEFAELMKGAKEVTRSFSEEFPLLSQFSSFEVVGELPDQRIALFSREKQMMYTTTLRDLTLDFMYLIAGSEAIAKLVRSDKEITDGKILFRKLKGEIIVAAGKCRLPEAESLKQGIHPLDDKRLLIVSGELATIWDGREFHTHAGPVIDGKFIEREPGGEWVNVEQLREAVLNMGHDKANSIVMDLRARVNQWGFASILDVDLVVGSILAQRVQAVWDWRAHPWVSGSAGSGKTQLLTFIRTVGGSLAKTWEGPTLSASGFRQDLKGSYPLLCIDEFEKTVNDERQKLIDFLRSAGRGGQSVKGTPSGKPIYFHIKHLVFIASIERSLARAADKDRYIPIEMKKDPGRKKPVIPDLEEARRLNLEYTAYALWASFKAMKLCEGLHNGPDHPPLAVEGLPPITAYPLRLVEAYSAPISMAVLTNDDPAESLETFLRMVLNERKDYADGELPDDEPALLDAILDSVLTVPVDEDGRSLLSRRSIRQLLGKNMAHKETLGAHGIKLCDEGLFLYPQTVERMLLKDSEWKGLNTRSILKRIPGAEPAQRRISGSPQRGILLRGWKTDTDQGESEKFKDA